MKKYVLILSLIGYGLLISTCKKDSEDDDHPNLLVNPNLSYGSVSDIDGNTYKTIQIGTQTWMAENLKTTMYPDGSSIANVTGDALWSITPTGAYCLYGNEINKKSAVGALYNWFAVDDNRKVCPKGWHIPNDIEWTQLTDFLGGEAVAEGK